MDIMNHKIVARSPQTTNKENSAKNNSTVHRVLNTTIKHPTPQLSVFSISIALVGFASKSVYSWKGDLLKRVSIQKSGVRNP